MKKALDMELAIECHNLCKHYPHFELSNVDLTVPTGSVMGFVGPNGAGKSTTMRILMGLVTPDEGTVSMLGYKMPSDQIKAKQEVGFVAEDMRLYAGQTLGFHMDFMQSVYPAWDAAYADELLNRFDLIKEQKTKGYSHGQRVKAMLLLALARKPKLLILDEPTTGLDPAARHEILQQLMEVLEDESRTVLFSSHNTLDIEQVSDHITFIVNGRINSSNDKETFLDSWRRIRLEYAPGVEPDPKTTVTCQKSGSLTVITTNQFSEGLLEKINNGACVHAVERMNLEEIFLASVDKEKGAR
jgi:ABC-2 type transport system ATP-binding protein